MELSKAEEGQGQRDVSDTAQLQLSAGELSSSGSKQPRTPANMALKIASGFVLAVVGFLVVYYVWLPKENDSNVIILDDSNTDVTALNTYYNDLQARFASSPTTYSTYSNMGPEGTPTLSGVEPEEFKSAVLEKFPDLAGIKIDRYIVSANVLEQDKDAKWGILRANVRGHFNQSILLSPDQVSLVQAIAGVSNDDDDSSGEDDTLATDDKGGDDNDNANADDDVSTVGVQKVTRKLNDIESANTFNWNEATPALHHAQTCYCDEDTYLTRTYGGPLTGFVPTYHISNPRYDTAGYIGYNTVDQTIHVAFRGSVSLNNWLSTNIDVVTTSYPYCSDCSVHSGFYDATVAVFPDILDEVQRLRGIYPNYKLIVSGHSLGGALSHLTALEFDAAGIGNMELYTFGSPRLANDDELAIYSTERLPTSSRVTHAKDLVVHTPGPVFYLHMAGEWHQLKDTVDVIPCSGFEDENCAMQYTFTSISDHMEYLGLEMGSDGCAGVTYD